jgi:hypothetical protein
MRPQFGIAIGHRQAQTLSSAGDDNILAFYAESVFQ